ncbi:MAG: hypothetical protein HC834_05040 [Rhodospirillales bacterium]|nr:hypothetical protein [Rhodospirillales bacterium]
MEEGCPYVSRGGLKLAAALEAIPLSVQGLTCADLGCSTGGFTDCLLQQGAARVYSVDTAYGQFAWKLRQDKRVTLLERTNALHMNPWKPERRCKGLADFAGVDWVVIDLGWTKQKLAIPAAVRWLRQDDAGDAVANPSRGIITLIKPQYEAPPGMVHGKAGGYFERCADHRSGGTGAGPNARLGD